MLHHCKWDTQVGDVSTLADFPLLIAPAEWSRLATLAERLTAETLDLEARLLRAPGLLPRLGLPRRLCGALASANLTPTLARVMRFDFHPTPITATTPTGWQVSEVNADVPGGYCEASELPDLFAAETGYPAIAHTGRLLATAIAEKTNGPIALLAAPGFMEDLQVVSYLAQQLNQLGISATVANPATLTWSNGHAHLGNQRLAGLFRFYQGEWLATRANWPHAQPLFQGGRTPVANAPAAVISESKRFPLLWDTLHADVPTWRSLLPETREARHAPWTTDDRWLLKAAYCNTGDAVLRLGQTAPSAFRRARLEAALFPRSFLAQRRFDITPINTPAGPRYPCVGIYTINGHAAGAYTRLSPKPIIDFAAVDCPLLLDHTPHSLNI